MLCFRYLLEELDEEQILAIDRQAEVANCGVTTYALNPTLGGGGALQLRTYNFVARGESDYFIGAYLLNLVAVEMLFALLLGAVVITTYPNTPWTALQWGGMALIIVGAIICYPMTQAIWLAADLMLRPMTERELNWHREGGAADRELPHL